jgi:hypothetical protein
LDAANLIGLSISLTPRQFEELFMRFLSWQNIKDNRIAHLLIITLAIWLACFDIWSAYFSTGDDFILTGLMIHRQSLGEALQGLGNGVRFLNFGMIWIKTQLYGLDASAYLLTGLVQQTLVSFIVYWLASFWSKRRIVGLLTALFFAVNFSYWEIVTRVSASDYSFWAVFYFLTLALFTLYLAHPKRIFYVASILCYLALAFGHDFTLSMPLVLIAYHITVGRGYKPLRSLGWSDLKFHLPYWLIWGIHFGVQLHYLTAGTSEAAFSDEAYGPGLHMIGNFKFLVHHVYPNIPGVGVLIERYGPTAGQVMDLTFNLLAAFIPVAALVLLWKGTNLMRFGLALVYLPFLQYTMWYGSFAGAPRYLYISSVGFALLLALLLTGLYEKLKQRNLRWVQLLTLGIVSIYFFVNVLVLQVWIRHHVASSQFRENFLTQMRQELFDVTADARIYIDVPDDRYFDLAYACQLVLPTVPADCVAFLHGERTVDEILGEVTAADGEIYILQASDAGFYMQLYPDPDT